MLASAGITIEQRDNMRIAPQRAEQLRSARANEARNGVTRYQQAPACSNPRCGGECGLCCADASSPALVSDRAADEEALYLRTIVKAHKSAVRGSKTPAIVKRNAAQAMLASDARATIRARLGAVPLTTPCSLPAHAILLRAMPGTVERTASAAKRQAKRADIGRAAQHDASAFRRTVEADERRDPRVRVDPATGDVVLPSY